MVSRTPFATGTTGRPDASDIRFAADGRVVYHRDYWDADEERYAELPAPGSLTRCCGGSKRRRREEK
jgi:hypothetical protein